MQEEILKNQIEFYFSDANLFKDKFLRGHIDKNEKGWVNISVIAAFKKVQSITKDVNFIISALQMSQSLEIDVDLKKLRRKTAIPKANDNDIEKRTIYISHFPSSISHDTLRDMFNEYGTVVHVSLPRDNDKPGKPLKGFAFIEFRERFEAANCVVYETMKKIRASNKGIGRIISKRQWKREERRRKREILEGKESIYNKKTEQENANQEHYLTKTESDDKKIDNKDATNLNNEIDFTPGLLVKYIGMGNDSTVRDLRNVIEMIATTAYLDYDASKKEAIARYHKPVAATEAVQFFSTHEMQVKSGVIRPTVLSGDEEVAYWKHIQLMRVNRQSQKASNNSTTTITSVLTNIPPRRSNNTRLSTSKDRQHVVFDSSSEEEKEEPSSEGKRKLSSLANDYSAATTSGAHPATKRQKLSV